MVTLAMARVLMDRICRLTIVALGSVVMAVPAWAQTKTRVMPAPEAVPLPAVMVELEPGVNAQVFAAFYGLELARPMRSLPNGFVFSTGTTARASAVLRELAADRAVRYSFQDHQRNIVPDQFVPNDPLYFFDPAVTPAGQWHLHNPTSVGGQGTDARLPGAWARGLTGQGVLVAAVDDGFEPSHPDLSANYNSTHSYDFRDGDANPQGLSGDHHGTAVTGIMAARGGNGVGVTGSAPYASWSGLRIGFGSSWTDSAVYDAVLFRSSGANTPIKIKNHSYGTLSVWDQSTSEAVARQISTQAGTIHVQSAGNSREGTADDSAKHYSRTIPENIVVAAIAPNGRYSYYSNYGAPVFVAAPSSGDVDASTRIGTLTTDRMNSAGYNGIADQNYTAGFGGTSSAAPLVAGILALLKEARPDLSTRFAKHLLARYSDVIHESDSSSTSDGGWRANAAGFKFNQNYGFGQINAGRLANAIYKYEGVTDRVVATSGTVSSETAIPDNTATGVEVELPIAGTTMPTEEVVVRVRVTHAYRGDLRMDLTSPSGTSRRIIVNIGTDSPAFNNATLRITANQFWGEDPTGVWRLKVSDRGASDLGTLHDATLTVHTGDVILKPEQNATFEVQEVPNSIYATQVFPVMVKMRNDGSEPWVAGEDYLVSMNPYANNNWSKIKVDLDPGETILPGQSKTFNFNVKAPPSAGTYNFQWQMRKAKPGIPAFNYGQVTENRPIEVLVGSHATFVSHFAPSPINVGSRNIAQVIMRNSGSTTWTYGNFYLVSQNPYANSTWGRIKADLNPGESIAPGQVKTFNFTTVAPLVPGSYNMQWQMRHGGVENFGELTPNLSIQVSRFFNSSFQSQSIPTTMQAGKVYSVTVAFANVGAAWTYGNQFLLSQNPLGNSIWGKERVQLDPNETVSAGGLKTFTFNVKAPSTPGNYNIQWQMRSVSPTREQFGDLSPNVVVNVVP